MSPIGGGLSLPGLGAVLHNSNTNAPILPADRATTWNPGLNSVGGIPNRTTVYTTVSPSGNDDSAAIQAAVNACPNNQVVMLATGTFIVNSFILINKPITLRGAGAGKTIVKKTNGATMVSYQAADYQAFAIMGPNRWPSPDNTSQNLTSDGAKGSTSITVANGSGFAAGQFVLLDELSGAQWQTDPLGRGQIWAAPDWKVTWDFHNPGIQYADDPLVATTPTSGAAASWFCRQDRPTAEIKQINSVNGNVINFTTPLHSTYRAVGTHTAQLTGYTGNPMVTNAGVENLTMIGFSDGSVRFVCAAFCWVKGVEITLWLNEGAAFVNAFKCELRDSYIHDGAWSEPGGGGYAISLADGSSEILIENNISVRANKVMVARCAGAGSVVGYNYTDEGFILTNQNWIEIGLNGSHMVGPHHMLFEGNYGHNWDSDKTHGSSTYHTIFRNYLRGIRSGPFTNPNTSTIVSAVMTGGTGYKVGDALTLNVQDPLYGLAAVLTVSAINGSGNPTSFTITKGGSQYTSTSVSVASKTGTGVGGNITATVGASSINDASQSGNGPRRCAGSTAYSYWMSFIGNVLGAQGQMSGWTYDVTGTFGMGTPAIWLLGWDDASPQPYDPKTATTTIREGNWDWLQSKQTWTTVPAQPLANSMYLASKPGFFGSNLWPWVDPTTGNVSTLPAKARYDAGTPNTVL